VRGQTAADELIRAVEQSRDVLRQVERWGDAIARVLLAGGRLLVAGNGGSAAEAQHLTAELVGRFGGERRPLSAICLHGDTSALTAICNDYGAEEMFARQVRAHGRPGDVLLLLSTSGKSPNVIAAARAAADEGITSLALTGPGPNPLAEACDHRACVSADSSATVQEVHLLAVHVICAAVDRRAAEEDAGIARHDTGEYGAVGGPGGPFARLREHAMTEGPTR
jgi:D-sedoheptulose 7-phosphate isomerase